MSIIFNRKNLPEKVYIFVFIPVMLMNLVKLGQRKMPVKFFFIINLFFISHEDLCSGDSLATLVNNDQQQPLQSRGRTFHCRMRSNDGRNFSY